MNLTGTQWNPVSKPVLLGGILAALCFSFYALSNSGEFLLLDYVNLPFHEAGHLFFRILGETASLWGGTLLQLIIPFGIMINFILKKEPAGVFFCSFWLGENLLNISTYINDARSMLLPLVGGGEHDWNIILNRINAIEYDHYIASVVSAIGWFIMLGSIVWFLITGMKTKEES